MTDELKQRLVGAGVLLILAGLLWPILFDFDQTLVSEPPASLIPAQPELARPQLARAEPGELAPEPAQVADPPEPQPMVVAPVEPDQRQAALLADAPEPPAVGEADAAQPDREQRPQLDASGVPVAYVVQLGTFSRWENADSLRARVADGDYKVFLRPAAKDRGGPYVVLAGPVMTYARAEQIKRDVITEHGLSDAFLKRFRPQS